MAVGSSMPPGICVAKLHVEMPLAAPASTDDARQPWLPKGLPATGVPKAVRWNRPVLGSGPTVVVGFQSPPETTLGSSLKSPWRIFAVGTVYTWLPRRCSLVWSHEKKKNVLSLPL